MNIQKLLRPVLILLSLALIAAICFFMPNGSEIRYSSAGIIDSGSAESFKIHEGSSAAELIMWRGEHAPMDTESRTFYLSVSPEGGKSLDKILPQLEIASSALRMDFVEDEYTGDIESAIRDNHSFRLLIQDGSDSCEEYRVIFTSLPVMQLRGKQTPVLNDGDFQNQGKVSIWNRDEDYFESYVNWHIRGNASRSRAKNSWKLNIINAKGQRSQGDILGMGRDDDWLLNPMGIDDIKIREKLFMELWNQNSDAGAATYKMSDGEYIELIINGRYWGLYFVHRKVEPELIGLDGDDLLFKGWQYTESYKLINGPGGEEEIRLNNAAAETDMLKNIDPENFADLSLMIQFASAVDNYCWRNTYYIVDGESGTVSLLPWDTDVSFGVHWNDEEACIDADPYKAAHFAPSATERTELELMRERYPELDEIMAGRWRELRSTVLDYDNIMSVADGLASVLESSGAMERDRERWGLFYEGRDTLDDLELFIRERLAVMDSLYMPEAEG